MRGRKVEEGACPHAQWHGSALLVATIMAPWLTSGYGAASTGGGTISMSLRRNCLLWQCTKAGLQALPLVEAGAEKVREGKERAQQRSAFREHDFDGGGDGGSTPPPAARRVRAPWSLLRGGRVSATASTAARWCRPPCDGSGAAMPPPPSVRTAQATTNTTEVVLSIS